MKAEARHEAKALPRFESLCYEGSAFVVPDVCCSARWAHSPGDGLLVFDAPWGGSFSFCLLVSCRLKSPFGGKICFSTRLLRRANLDCLGCVERVVSGGCLQQQECMKRRVQAAVSKNKKESLNQILMISPRRNGRAPTRRESVPVK